ncbi:hypothetical protein B0H67DRAFT_602166 [Lasiosphaeris hirsuta]|uniref:Uncharacterized protein n=1 Tax=Lasiosphaeris hirsuta TaxID=260670 RepID=A0AA40A8P4_9PEZI|nr:hypothetical protein B0H67DRAFT_602166 [Lasiosphaeris hirsuta]
MTRSASARAGPSLPSEIWWLVAQELANRHDFAGLFLCASLSRGLAKLALPLLYGIQDQSPASDAHILNIEPAVCLWRSIIISSLGMTLYPYCSWVKTLKLGNLRSLLDDADTASVKGNLGLRKMFFDPPLQELEICRGKKRSLDVNGISAKVLDLVTESIHSAAEAEDRFVGLTMLEVQFMHGGKLATCLSRLARLTTLTIYDGSVLNGDVARAISENCPAFQEVVCYTCPGDNADTKLAGFILGLAPNTLKAFTVNSQNDIGPVTLAAFSRHSDSLLCLGLFSLQSAALNNLEILSPCTALSILTVESAAHWTAYSGANTDEIIAWLQNCGSLKELEFIRFVGASELLAKVFKTSPMRLEYLRLDLLDISDDFYPQLANQTDLRRIRIRYLEEELLDTNSEERVAQFTAALTKITQLGQLHTNELFRLADIDALTDIRPPLEELNLNGDFITDDFLPLLARLSHLKYVNVFGPSWFSVPALVDFFVRLQADPAGQHEGLQLYVAHQNWEAKFLDSEEIMLATEIDRRFRGKFDVVYRAGPDELHEEDFSD